MTDEQPGNTRFAHELNDEIPFLTMPYSVIVHDIKTGADIRVLAGLEHAVAAAEAQRMRNPIQSRTFIRPDAGPDQPNRET